MGSVTLVDWAEELIARAQGNHTEIVTELRLLLYECCTPNFKKELIERIERLALLLGLISFVPDLSSVDVLPSHFRIESLKPSGLPPPIADGLVFAGGHPGFALSALLPGPSYLG